MLDKINNYVSLGAELKKEFRTFITNKEIPLNERWSVWTKAPSSLKDQYSWIVQFKFESNFPSGNIYWSEDFYYERHEKVDMVSFVERLSESKKYNDIDLDAVKEEILSRNLESFLYDW